MGNQANNSFLGLGWGFPPEFAKRGKKVRMVEQEDDIQEALFILLSTTPGERIMYPKYGCGIKSFAFKNMTSADITEMKDLIERAILLYEPRITLDLIDIDTGSASEGLLRIALHYTVRATNTRSNMVYPFYLLEGTNIAQ